jgi:hypothetical protein
VTTRAIVPAPDAKAVASALALDLTTRVTHITHAHRMLAGATVADDAEYAEATAERAAWRKEADEFERAYKAAVAPWQTIVRAVQDAFRPGKEAYAALDVHLRTLLEAHVQRKALALRAAEREAQEAAQADDTTATLTALATAQAAAAPLMGGGAIRWTWRVKRIAADLVPKEWWCVDEARIAAFAAAHKGEDAPVVPGVVFEREASVSVSRRGAP